MQPQVGVGVVVLDGEKVLLIKRGKPPRMGEWSLPGGRLELGETLYSAAVREIAEETGLNVIPQAIVDVIEFIDQSSENSVLHHYILVDYWAIVSGGVLQADDDAIDAAWYNVGDLAILNMWGKTLDVIDKAVHMRDASETK